MSGSIDLFTGKERKKIFMRVVDSGRGLVYEY